MTGDRLGIVYIGQLKSSPLGRIWVAVSEQGLIAVEVSADQGALKEQLVYHGYQEVVIDQGKTSLFLEQIEEYLNGKRKDFELPIDWSVLTPFQERALRATFEIPYGQVTTYGKIASLLGNPRAARAVGHAEATNPMPLVVPCHRVIGADGGLHGYGAGKGLATKAWLLELEQKG